MYIAKKGLEGDRAKDTNNALKQGRTGDPHDWMAPHYGYVVKAGDGTSISYLNGGRGRGGFQD